MKISLDIVYQWLATTSMIACRTRKMFRKFAFAIDDRDSPIW
jgi:hypothetical protein